MGKTRTIYEIINKEASELEFELNRTIDFAKRSEGDHNSRRFIVARITSTPRGDSSLPRKYGLGIYYVFNGTKYTVIEPKAKVIDGANVWSYLEMFRELVTDISNGYSGEPITKLDHDFADLVKKGRITKTKE